MLPRANSLRLALMTAALATPFLLTHVLGAQSPPSSQRVVATEISAPQLPESFAGFELQGKLEKTTAPEAADPANVQVLTEDGFRDFASGTYKNNGNTVTIRAMRFADAS